MIVSETFILFAWSCFAFKPKDCFWCRIDGGAVQNLYGASICISRMEGSLKRSLLCTVNSGGVQLP